MQSNQWLGYTALFNLLNYAAVTAPIGKADGELDHPVAGIDNEWKGYAPRNKADRFNYDQCMFFLPSAYLYLLRYWPGRATGGGVQN